MIIDDKNFFIGQIQMLDDALSLYKIDYSYDFRLCLEKAIAYSEAVYSSMFAIYQDEYILKDKIYTEDFKNKIFKVFNKHFKHIIKDEKLIVDHTDFSIREVY